jgi:hypothetical protein
MTKATETPLFILAQKACVFLDNVDSLFINDAEMVKDFHGMLTADESEFLNEFAEIEKAYGYDTMTEMLEKAVIIKSDETLDSHLIPHILKATEIYDEVLSSMMTGRELAAMKPDGLEDNELFKSVTENMAPKASHAQYAIL